MKRKDTKKYPSAPSEEPEDLLTEEEYEGSAPSLDEFKSRRRGPDLRLPLGLLLTLLIMAGVGYFLWQYMQVEAHQGGTLVLNEICTANHKQSYKFILPEVTIEPGGYLLIYFVGGSEEADSDPLCTGFGLSRYGEDLLLVDANYNLLDSVEVPSLEPDVSYARTSDGSWGYAVIPTPGQANNEENIIPAWQ